MNFSELQNLIITLIIKTVKNTMTIILFFNNFL